MSISIFELVINIISDLLFKSKNGNRTVLCMNTIEVPISNLVEYHVEPALFNIRLEDFL